MRNRTARIRFKCKLGNFPDIAELAKFFKAVFVGAAEGTIESMRPFKHGGRPAKPFLRQQCCYDAAVRRPSRMQTFRPASVREVFDNSRALAPAQPESIGPLSRIEPIKLARGCGGAKGRAQGGRMKTAGMEFSRRHQTHFA